MFILYLEKKLVSMIVERQIADPRNEYWNFLQKLNTMCDNFILECGLAAFKRKDIRSKFTYLFYLNKVPSSQHEGHHSH